MRAAIEAQVSDVEALEGIAGQTAFCINQKARTRLNPFGWQLSPNIERASAAHKRKVVEAKPKKPPKQKPIAPAIIACPATPAVISSYDDLIIALRARADELQISRETIDVIAGTPDRLASKVMSLNKTRRIGMQTLGAFLGALSVKLVMVVDEVAFEQNRSRYVKRDDAHFRSATARHGLASTKSIADDQTNEPQVRGRRLTV
jgi:hypothetical protein